MQRIHFRNACNAIIIGGVSAGFFTATESAAVACIYCLFMDFFIYRELRWDIPVVLGNTIKTFPWYMRLLPRQAPSAG